METEEGEGAWMNKGCKENGRRKKYVLATEIVAQYGMKLIRFLGQFKYMVEGCYGCRLGLIW